MFKLSDILLNPKKSKRHPIEIILLGFFYVSVSLLLSLWIFPEYSSLLMVFLSVIACLYVAEGVLIMEEDKEKKADSESWILKEHLKALWFFILLFLGFVFAFAFWTIALPESLSSVVFNLQKSSLPAIESITGNATSNEVLQVILFNNLRVLLLALLFSLFYGAGAIFILAWNASIMGFVIGSLTKNSLGIAALPYAFLKYFMHGIPEMLAYFAAALAGGIIFMAIIRRDIEKDRIKRTLRDTSLLIAASILLLIIAALVEVYISSSI